MLTYELQSEADNDQDEMAETEIERFGIVLVLGLMVLTVLMLGTLLYLY